MIKVTITIIKRECDVSACVLFYILSKFCKSFTRHGGGFCASFNPNTDYWKNRKMPASCLGYIMSKT